jgi:phosphoglycolate phosphatase-like HAD superfamily hydrolase
MTAAYTIISKSASKINFPVASSGVVDDTDRLLGVFRLADHLHVPFCGDDLLQAAPHDRMIIDSNHSDHPVVPP